ncbi:MAG: GWxTD domain-containing protein [Melioribacteraceae bacterium]|nr:GWxTD domain-containing protein [Melioribacteraceae bacterium]
MKIIFCILFITELIFSQTSSDENSNHRKGLEFLKTGDTINAVLYLGKSIESSNYADSYLELAKIKIKKNTPNSRNEALDILKKASLIYGNNITVCLDYARLLEDFAPGSADSYYLDLLELEPRNAHIYYRLGVLKTNEFKDYFKSRQKTSAKNISSNTDSSNTESSFSRFETESLDLFYDEFADEDFKIAEEHLQMSIEIDPDFKEAYLQLFYLYEYAGKYDESLELLLPKKKLFENISSYHLYIGLLYYKTGKFENSYQNFRTALKLMDFNKKMEFEYHSVKKLLASIVEKDIEEYSYDQILDMIDYYWRLKEPLHLTDFNERVLEHYSRLAVADLHFRSKNSNESGWKTDQGEIILRYGEPKERIRYRPWIDDDVVASKTDVWIYDYMTLGFSDQYWSGDFKYSAPYANDGSQFRGNTHDVVNDIFKTANEVYIPEFEGPTLDLVSQIAVFRGLEDTRKTDLYINYLLPCKDTMWIEGTRFLTGIHQFDDEYNKVSGIVDSVNLKGISRGTIDTTEYYFVSSHSEFEKAKGNFAFEILRQSDKGAVSNRFKIEDYYSKSVMISDPLLCFNISEDNEELFTIDRNGVYLFPNPLNLFTRKDNIYLYFEIYNLAKQESGLTDYNLNTTITAVEEGKIVKTLDAILDIVGINSEGEKISLSSSMKAMNNTEQVYYQIDLSKVAVGKYKLNIEIEDKVSDKIVSKNIEFSLIN